MAQVDLSVDPGRGVNGFRLGASEDAVRQELVKFGEVFDATSPGGFLTLRVQGRDPNFAIYASFEEGALSAIEIWRPEDINFADLVLEGVRLFGAPASRVLDSLTEMGHVMDLDDPYHPTLPDLAIALNREGGDFADDDGFAPHFQSILIAPPGSFARP